MLAFPAAFWLLPFVLAALLWIRFFRTRKQELLAGSLLIWKRLAAQQPLKPPRRFEFDRSLVLQALALTALVAALANPRFQTTSGSGRTFVIAADNGPLTRFVGLDGKTGWSRVATETQSALATLKGSDRVILIRAAPTPKILTPEGTSPAEALELLARIKPALSGPDSGELLEFARNTSRTSDESSTAVFSASPAPSSEADSAAWFCVGVQTKPNAGLVAFGIVPKVKDGVAGAEILARVCNAGSESWKGAFTATQNNATLAQSALEIAPGEDGEIRLEWVRTDQPLSIQLNSEDGLAEDNQLTARPRETKPLTVRFHAKLPALERLFVSALQAQLIPAESTTAADLEIHAGIPPQQLPKGARGLMLIEPTAGYRFFFDVGETMLAAPRVSADEPSALTDKFGSGGEAGLFHVPQAIELLRTGPYTSLLKDAKSQRTLAARFIDEQNRPGYVLAFTPGAGAPPEALLPPELATLLIRMAREAAGAGELFTLETAAQQESRTSEPLDASAGEFALLNEGTTALQPGKPSAQKFDANRASLTKLEAALDLRPWLILLAMVCMGMDFVLARRSVAALARA